MLSRHEEIIFRADRTRQWAQNNMREIIADGVEIALGFEFAPSVSRIRFGHIVFGNLRIRSFLFDGAEDAERTQIDKSFDGHVQCQYCIHQILRALCVHTEEIVFVQAFRNAGGMNHIIENDDLRVGVSNCPRTKSRVL